MNKKLRGCLGFLFRGRFPQQSDRGWLPKMALNKYFISDAKGDFFRVLRVVLGNRGHILAPVSRRQTELVHYLAKELKVDLRDFWRPDARWLAGFKKIQLAHLIVELKGQVHAPAPERKKSELVEVLEKLFADAVEGKLPDKQLAQTINAWLPSNLRTVELRPPK